MDNAGSQHCSLERTLLGQTMSDDFEDGCRFYEWRWMFDCVTLV